MAPDTKITTVPDGGVDHLDVTVVSLCDRVHQTIPNACRPPAVVDRGRRAVARRHVRPWHTRAKAPEHAVQHPPVIDPRHPTRLVGKMRLDRLPLEVRQVVAAHRKAPEKEFESQATP